MRPVVLAANFDLMASFNPALANAVTTNHAGATGDGILMAEAIGADTVDMDQIQLHPTVYQETGLLVSESVRSMGGILVNAEGKRFCNDLATVMLFPMRNWSSRVHTPILFLTSVLWTI